MQRGVTDKGVDGLEHIREYEKMLQVIPAAEKLASGKPMDMRYDFGQEASRFGAADLAMPQGQVQQ